MGYEIIETSEYSGHPIEIYTFTRSTDVFRYTSSDEDKTFGGETYLSIPLRRDAVMQDVEAARMGLTLQVSKDLPVIQTYRGSPSANVTFLTILRYHEGDSEAIVVWLGRVVDVKFTERDARVKCDPFFTSLKRPVLRLRYQKNCPHVLYATACRVNRASFMLTTTLIGVNGIQLLSGDFALRADGYYTGGYVEWDNGGINERRFILSHAGSELILDLPFVDMLGGAEVTAYPGCDHSLGTCSSKFGNSANYGGFPYFPKQNPFGQSPIF